MLDLLHEPVAAWWPGGASVGALPDFWQAAVLARKRQKKPVFCRFSSLRQALGMLDLLHEPVAPWWPDGASVGALSDFWQAAVLTRKRKKSQYFAGFLAVGKRVARLTFCTNLLRFGGWVVRVSVHFQILEHCFGVLAMGRGLAQDWALGRGLPQALDLGSWTDSRTGLWVVEWFQDWIRVVDQPENHPPCANLREPVALWWPGGASVGALADFAQRPRSLESRKNACILQVLWPSASSWHI